MSRITSTFDRLKADNKKAFVAYVMAGDPDFDRSLELVYGLPGAGVDIIELGLPFTDPMADGITIQLAGQRALEAGMTLDRTLEMVRLFRETNNATPIVLMGYYNPIYSRGVKRFLEQATLAGIDGLIIVDLPPEEDDELCIPAQEAGLHFIRLATPTTDDKRLPKVLLCLDHRHHRCRRKPRGCRTRGRADQGGNRSAGYCRVWRTYPRDGRRDRRHCRRRGCRLCNRWRNWCGQIRDRGFEVRGKPGRRGPLGLDPYGLDPLGLGP